MRPALRQFWLRLSAWTPIALLAVAAAFSWWVAQVVMRAEQPPAVAAARSSLPDYLLHGFSAARYDDHGVLRAVLQGAQMVHLPATDTFDISAPQLRVVNPQGVVVTASALRGLSNKDGSNVQLLGDAVVQRSAAGQAPIVVRSGFLNVFPNQQIVQSNRPTVVTQGATRFAGDSLDFDGIAGTAAMHGRVRAVIAPGAQTASRP
ncbi:LPS export ABC transporter periplasmic protein LptC [Thiomonas sp.]|jgi:lipopolysaccharide export system protein LptC|uniref:LPS export ABC transporter periplasmic protein LptC n=1 Tax=Thiomonas sp. TaxID=2047785 RepID=UPI00260C0300|nr:LPS export ABC transporter periplasmic protein LptC [Thiomonas sp.]